MRCEVERYRVPIKHDLPPENAAFLTGGELRRAPVPADALRDLERAWLHVYDAAKRISPAVPVHRQTVRDLDVSADDFFAPLGLGRAASDFVNAMIIVYSGADPAETSMLAILTEVAAFGCSPYGFFGALTDRFDGGTRVLLDRMISGASIDVRLQQVVTGIDQRDGGVTATTSAGEDFRARACIVAVPTNVIRHLSFSPPLGASKVRALAENHASRGYKLTMLVTNVPRRPFALGMGELKMVCLGHELNERESYLIAFGYEGSNIDLLSTCDAEKALREYFPDARVLDCDAHDWNNDALFDGPWRFERPGCAYTFPTIMNEPEGRVVFAGADVDDSVWRVWMEGALNSGHAAAHRVQAMLREHSTSPRRGRQ
jgi:hypothetical protein